MPLYTIFTQDDFVSAEKKAIIAREVTRIHMTVMKVPSNFVRVVFVPYPAGSGFAAGASAPTALIQCALREGHTVEDKAALMNQIWVMFQSQTGTATDQLAISLHELPASNAMELGKIMPAVGNR
jgi:phenylpyruvate tautomerase PptA (4-oxalocrotonate tautomerase family)